MTVTRACGARPVAGRGAAGATCRALLLAVALAAPALAAPAAGSPAEPASESVDSPESGPNASLPYGGESYLFYRELRSEMQRADAAGGDTERRVFGGRAVSVDAWGAACALLDARGAPHCSGAVVAPRWALTAAHCASAAAAVVRHSGGAARVAQRLRHPYFAVRLEDEGAGLDVVALQHDVGLLRTHAEMCLRAPPPEPPLQALHRVQALGGQELEVLGFGRAGRLVGARLRGAACARAAWHGCVCARATGAGVCAGDSGGPALLRGALVALASLGPRSCARAPAPPAAALSVLTPLQPYAAMIDATLAGRPGGFVPAGPAAAAGRAGLLPALLLLSTH